MLVVDSGWRGHEMFMKIDCGYCTKVVVELVVMVMVTKVVVAFDGA